MDSAVITGVIYHAILNLIGEFELVALGILRYMMICALALHHGTMLRPQRLASAGTTA